jgi:hypothetical protein
MTDTARTWRSLDPPSDRPATADRPSRCPDDEQVDPDMPSEPSRPQDSTKAGLELEQPAPICRPCIDEGTATGGLCQEPRHQAPTYRDDGTLQVPDPTGPLIDFEELNEPAADRRRATRRPKTGSAPTPKGSIDLDFSEPDAVGRRGEPVRRPGIYRCGDRKPGLMGEPERRCQHPRGHDGSHWSPVPGARSDTWGVVPDGPLADAGTRPADSAAEPSTVEAALAAARAEWDSRTGPIVSDTTGTDDMLRDITEAVLVVAARARQQEPSADLREALEVIAEVAHDTDDTGKLPRSLPAQLRTIARLADDALNASPAPVPGARGVEQAETAGAEPPADVHPREDAVHVVTAALIRLGCEQPVDPYDPEDCGSVASEAVWALLRAGMLPAEAESPADLREAIAAAIDVERGNHVADWPEDERAFFRHAGCADNTDRAEKLRALRYRKSADAILAVVQAHVAAEGAKAQHQGMHYAAYQRVQKVLDRALGTEEADGAGEGIAEDVALLAQQRDRARAEVERARAALLAALDDVDAHQRDPEHPVPADWRAGWHGACVAAREALDEYLPGPDESPQVTDLRTRFEAAIRSGGKLPYLSADDPDELRERSLADGATQALRDLAGRLRRHRDTLPAGDSGRRIRTEHAARAAENLACEHERAGSIAGGAQRD